MEPMLRAARQQLHQARKSGVAINKLIAANQTLASWGAGNSYRTTIKPSVSRPLP
jgi:hypothetical protein